MEPGPWEGGGGFMPELKTAIDRAAENAAAPSGEAYRRITLAAVRKLAGDFSCPPKEVEVTALKEGIVPDRYQRSMGTTGGTAGQLRLLQSKAAVIGLGGLGGLTAELLARMGVGELVLVDADTFSESNLNRQLFATEENLGREKALVADNRIKQVNSAVETIIFNTIADEGNIDQILEGCSVALDCLDNLKTRFMLQEACQRLAIPMVHGAIAQFYGQVCTVFPGDAGLEAIYGPYRESQNKGVEVELGNPAATPALVAAWQVQEAIKILLDRGELLRNCLLLLDTERCSWEILNMNRARR